MIFFGTRVIRTALWLLTLALRLAGWLVLILFGLTSLLALAFLDRRQLARIWHNELGHAGSAALLARERWG